MKLPITSTPKIEAALEKAKSDLMTQDDSMFQINKDFYCNGCGEPSYKCYCENICPTCGKKEYDCITESDTGECPNKSGNKEE